MTRRRTFAAAPPAPATAPMSLADHLFAWVAGRLSPFLPTDRLTALETRMVTFDALMQQIDQAVADLKAADQQDDARDAAALADLQKQVDDLKTQVQAGTLTDDQAAQIKAKFDDLKASLNKPDNGGTPTPTPAPADQGGETPVAPV